MIKIRGVWDHYTMAGQSFNDDLGNSATRLIRLVLDMVLYIVSEPLHAKILIDRLPSQFCQLKLKSIDHRFYPLTYSIK